MSSRDRAGLATSSLPELRADEARIDEDAVMIGDAAAQLGISESALRVYDRMGLVVFPRDRRGYRWVGRREIERIRTLRAYVQANRLNLQSIVALAATLPCWLMKHCPGDERDTCRYRAQSEQPCWSVHRDSGGCLSQRCADCSVYVDVCDWIDSLRGICLAFSGASSPATPPGRSAPQP